MNETTEGWSWGGWGPMLHKEMKIKGWGGEVKEENKKKVEWGWGGDGGNGVLFIFMFIFLDFKCIQILRWGQYFKITLNDIS